MGNALEAFSEDLENINIEIKEKLKATTKKKEEKDKSPVSKYKKKGFESEVKAAIDVYLDKCNTAEKAQKA